MRRFLLDRALQSGVLLLGLSVLLFTLLAYTPGDPVELLAQANPEVQPEDVQRLRQYPGAARGAARGRAAATPVVWAECARDHRLPEVAARWGPWRPGVLAPLQPAGAHP